MKIENYHQSMKMKNFAVFTEQDWVTIQLYMELKWMGSA
jgi:hypothetical protein